MEENLDNTLERTEVVNQFLSSLKDLFDIYIKQGYGVSATSENIQKLANMHLGRLVVETWYQNLGGDETAEATILDEELDTQYIEKEYGIKAEEVLALRKLKNN